MADAEVAMVGVGDAAETGAEATSHHILEGEGARDMGIAGDTGDGLEHRGRAAGCDMVEAVELEARVLGDEAMMTQGAVVGGEENIGERSEGLIVGDERGRTTTEEDSGADAREGVAAGEIEERGDAGAATDEERMRAHDVEAMAKGEDDIEGVADSKIGKSARATAHNLDEEREGVVVGVDIVDRDRAAEEDIA